MSVLPPSLEADYRAATTKEVSSWSFGQLKKRRTPASDWREQRGTLDDQAIFGPLRDCECACGKYRDSRCRGMICDRCGVKVTAPAVRRERFGHVELGAEVRHPLGAAADMLSAFPVLPAALVGSPAGAPLMSLYEELVEAAAAGSADRIVQILGRLVEVILPIAYAAHEWRLAETATLARGLALQARDESSADV